MSDKARTVASKLKVLRLMADFVDEFGSMCGISICLENLSGEKKSSRCRIEQRYRMFAVFPGASCHGPLISK